MEKTFNMSDIARELGVTPQAIRGRYERAKKSKFSNGTIPPPDGEYGGKPFWLEQTLRKSGVIK